MYYYYEIKNTLNLLLLLILVLTLPILGASQAFSTQNNNIEDHKHFNCFDN